MSTPCDLFIRVHENAVNDILESHFGYFCEIIRGENSGFKWELTNQKAGYPRVEFESKDPYDTGNDFYIQFGLEIKYQPDKQSISSGDVFLIETGLLLFEKSGKLSFSLKDKPTLIKSFSKDPASKELFAKFLEVTSFDLEKYLEQIQLPDVSLGVNMPDPDISCFDGNLFILNSFNRPYHYPTRFGHTAMEIRVTPALLGQIMKNRVKTPINITELEEKSPIKSLSINPKWESLNCNSNGVSLDIAASGTMIIDKLICSIETKDFFNVHFGIGINNLENNHDIQLSYVSSDPLKLKLIPFPNSTKAFFEAILAIFMTMGSINLDGIAFIKEELTKHPVKIGKIPNVTITLTQGRKMLCSPELSIGYDKHTIIIQGNIKTSII